MEKFKVGKSRFAYCSNVFDVGVIIELSFENDELKENIIASKEKVDSNYIYKISDQIATEEDYDVIYMQGDFYSDPPVFVECNIN